MRIKRSLACILLIFLAVHLMACGTKARGIAETGLEETDSTGIEVRQPDVPGEREAEEEKDKDTDKDKDKDKDVNEVLSEKEEVKEEPAVDPDSKKLQGEYAHLDNTRLAWWFRREKDNKPSTTNADIEALLKKYDGMFIEHTDQKVLYLTFDEGYENGYTPKILDILKENKVPAAFFITGSYLKHHEDLVKRMVEEGHIVANHTVTHPSMPGVFDEKKLEEEILGVERAFYEAFQKNMKYLRPPKGEYSERTLAITQNLGYQTVFWSFAYRDWETDKQKGADYAYKNVMGGIHNGAILLLHAVSQDNAEALERIIKDAREKGYEFKSLDDIALEQEEEE